MRLKLIKLAGFKSFVDPTTVSFAHNLSAVVGPNGCGKSNIIDAVRWVMGESSAKNLRGQSMTDVIFNGSSGRKPVGQASIELVFDNSDGTVQGEYAAFSEISVKRRVDRNSDNQYFLNGQKCRRRDITDIFLGTGLGPRSYAIIEQGMISKLIEAKPDELRIYIEEAAGISKYKERRRETETRMRRTQENLERLNDIREELDKQLQHLHRQAQAAEKYSEYKKQERLMKAQWQALQWRSFNEQVQLAGQGIEQAELAVESLVTRQVHLDSQVEQLFSKNSEARDSFEQIQGQYYALGADIARTEQMLSSQKKQYEKLHKELAQSRESLLQAEKMASSDEQKQALCQEQLRLIEPDYEVLLEAQQENDMALLEAEQAMQDWQQGFDEFSQSDGEQKRQAEVQQSHIVHSERVLQRLNERKQRFEQEYQLLLEQEVGDGDDSLLETLAEFDVLLEGSQEQLEQLRMDSEQLRQNLTDKQDDLDELKTQLQQQTGKLSSWQALQQSVLDNTSDGVAKWTMQQGLTENALLAENLSVQAGYEKAVEIVLGRHLQAICVEQISDFADKISLLEKAQMSLIEPLASANDALASQSLASKVDNSALRSLLSSVLVADTLEQALVLRSKLADYQSVITPEGIWLGPNWLFYANEQDAQAGFIQRQGAIEQLEVQIKQDQQKRQQLEQTVEQDKAQLKQLDQQLQHNQRQYQQYLQQYHECKAQCEQQKVKAEQKQLRLEQLQAELDEARSQAQIEQENLEQSRTLLQQAIELMDEHNQQRQHWISQRDSLRQTVTTLRQKTSSDKEQQHQLAMQKQALSSQLQGLAHSLQRSQEQVQQLGEKCQQLALELAEQAQPDDELSQQLEVLLDKRLAVEQRLAKQRQQVEAVEIEQRQTEQQRVLIVQDIQQARQALEQQRLACQTLVVKRDNLRQQLEQDNYQLAALLDSLPALCDEQQFIQEIEQLGQRISRLGAINLAAIEEYQTALQRKTYLDQQNDDLCEALQTLENAIRKIDRETRARFKETFDQINQGMQDLFPKVFGGGRAYLEMTGDDLLDTGVAIMAQPPGKRNSTIHLLSGGEKALTALSLVFSIFHLNPAPFCMLDEVDAPLDDANVGRYAKMVQEMSKQVQFIYITHNKIAMEMAQQLLGVTMHEPGVSRMVTVNVEEAAELAAS